ncbi:MAG: hypothetical protein KBT12_05995 [Bacteroidales bacterium]|nr:hypothetical protein [Candidatus Physcousia equi]
MARILRYIFIAAISFTLCFPAQGKTSKYRVEVEMPPAKLLNGFGVGVDLVGAGMWLTGARFGSLEAMARLNLLEKYFPVFELGIGKCDREGEEQQTKFHAQSPYFRIGLDYCLTQKRNGNRLFLGARYGFTSQTYDYSNEAFQDPIYEASTTPLHFEGLRGKTHWLELCVGIETRLWSIVRLGFSIRFKPRLSTDYSEHGEPWYVPGFGKNGITTWGGSVNLMFDL